MNKIIDADRIRNTLRLIQAARTKAMGTDPDVVQALALRGLTGVIADAFHQEVSEAEEDRLTLTRIYHDISNKPAAIAAVRNRFFFHCNHYGDKTERVYAIQERYEISGLVESTTQLGDREITHLWVDEELRLIPSDLPKLADSKLALFEAWSSYVTLNQLSLYRRSKDREDPWQPISLEAIAASLPFYDWATVDELNSRKIWEVYLDLGSGTDESSAETSRLSICAANSYPSI